MKRRLLVAPLAAGFLVALAVPAAAHPLGNFTVNTADRVVVGAESVRVQHVVDAAEIPTLQLAQSPDGPDADRDGRTTDAELADWARGECERTGAQLSLVLDGRAAALRLTQATARTVPGQAGLATQRTECTFDSDRTARDRVEFSDPTSAGRTGWKEVSATALCGRVTGAAGLPQESPSALLTRYPEDLLSSPLEVSSATFGVSTGGACRTEGDGAAPASVLPRGIDRITSAYTAFVGQQELTLPVALLAVLLSVALGCGHAVAPGHGKTVIAAYLVGQRGTRRQALWLGATVTATHTAGVLLLGAVLSLTSVTAPERFVPATEVASGLLLAGVGVFLLRRTRRQHSPHDHDHDHGSSHDHDDPHDHDHPHDHDDPHDHGSPHDHERDHGAPHDHAPAPDRQRELVSSGAPAAPEPGRVEAGQHAAGVHSHGGRAHSHLPLPDAPLGWRTLATMGIAGGLVPSPSALVVLLGASALGRPVFGAVLVTGYGVGMALTLTLAGLLLLRARARLDTGRWAGGRAARVVRLLPALTATVVLLVGGLVVLRGLFTLGSLG